MPLSEIILIIMGLLTVAMLAAGLCRNLPIPYTVFLVILGLIFGLAARRWHELEFLLEFQLTQDIVLFIFLPALIFESAINLDARQLLKDLAPVLILAIPALLISTAIVGTGLWLILDIGLVLALLFGALISATDPVAVVALFKELGAPKRLTILVEGESLFNDATAIVLFTILLGLLQTGEMSLPIAGLAFGEFLYVFLGGAVIGGLFGMFISEMLYRLRFGISAYLVMSIVLAYASFSIAEHLLHVSGVMAVVASAIAMGSLGVSRIPQSASHLVTETWEMIALVCNSLLFLLVGLSVDIMQLIARFDVILIAIALLLFARACTVYTMVPAAISLFKLPLVTLGERHIMWWGGLKGGLAIAIVLSIPTEIAGRGLLLDMTLGVVMFTLLVNAPTIRPLIHRLGIDRLTGDERADLKHGLHNARIKSGQILKHMQEVELISDTTGELIQKKCEQVFDDKDGEVDERLDIRHLYIAALRVELDELKHVYDNGLIQHYIYLDIKNNILRDREIWLMDAERRAHGEDEDNIGIFHRIENGLIRRLREHDWATGILARYQYLRFSQSLQRDMAGVIISSRVIDMLERQLDHDKTLTAEVEEVYKKRLDRRRKRLKEVASEYPDFYLRFETRLFAKVAMQTANHYAEEAHHDGEIGSKAYSNIESRIRKAIDELPSISMPVPKHRPSDLIATVPLLNGLSNDLLEKLADATHVVTFLGKDVIIGEGDRGDALYIISHGEVSVVKEDKILAELRDGDFFGEMALLGDQVRTANVVANTATTLLRLTRKDVLTLAEADPELKIRLEDAEDVRRSSSEDK
jgi:CPA1 family monovalent cation:H+ antiporter